MPKVSQQTLDEVREALDGYSRELESSSLAPGTIVNYVRFTNRFVRWLEDDFEPGSRTLGIRHWSQPIRSRPKPQQSDWMPEGSFPKREQRWVRDQS